MKKYLNISKLVFVSFFVASLFVVAFPINSYAQKIQVVGVDTGDTYDSPSSETLAALSGVDPSAVTKGGYDYNKGAHPKVSGFGVMSKDAYLKEVEAFELKETVGQVTGTTPSEVKTTEGGTTSKISGGGAPKEYSSYIGGDGCSDAKNPFETIACKAMKTLNDLKILIYILSGFGLVVFTWGAIFGKINWNHLAQLGIGLFLVTMMVPFIALFATDGASTQKFQKWGDQISGREYLLRSEGLEKTVADGKSPEDVGADVTTTPKEKYGWKDLAGSVKSAVKTVHSASAAVSQAREATKQVIEGVSNAADAIKNVDMTNLDSITYSAGKLANSADQVASASSSAANNLQYSLSSAADGMNDIRQTNKGREENEKARAEGTQTNKLSAFIRGTSTGETKGADGKYRDAQGNTLDYTEKDGRVVDSQGKVVGVLNSNGKVMTESKTAKTVDDMHDVAVASWDFSQKTAQATTDAQILRGDAQNIGANGTQANIAGIGVFLGGFAGAGIDASENYKNRDDYKIAAQNKANIQANEDNENLRKQRERSDGIAAQREADLLELAGYDKIRDEENSKKAKADFEKSSTTAKKTSEELTKAKAAAEKDPKNTVKAQALKDAQANDERAQKSLAAKLEESKKADEKARISAEIVASNPVKATTTAVTPAGTTAGTTVTPAPAGTTATTTTGTTATTDSKI